MTARKRGRRRPGPGPQLALGACPACSGLYGVEGGRLTRHSVTWTTDTPNGPATTTRPCPDAGGPPRPIEAPKGRGA